MNFPSEKGFEMALRCIFDQHIGVNQSFSGEIAILLDHAKIDGQTDVGVATAGAFRAFSFVIVLMVAVISGTLHPICG